MFAQLCISTLGELEALVRDGLELREVGSSSVHAQSSRSHALLEVEVLTPRVLAARAALMRAKGAATPVGKELTDLQMVRDGCWGFF